MKGEHGIFFLVYRTFCPETFVSVNIAVYTVVPCKTNILKGFLKKKFIILFLTATAEAPPSEEDTITSPVRNLQKKTDLFQLQKVFVFLFCLNFSILSEFLSCL